MPPSSEAPSLCPRSSVSFVFMPLEFSAIHATVLPAVEVVAGLHAGNTRPNLPRVHQAMPAKHSRGYGDATRRPLRAGAASGVRDAMPQACDSPPHGSGSVLAS